MSWSDLGGWAALLSLYATLLVAVLALRRSLAAARREHGIARGQYHEAHLDWQAMRQLARYLLDLLDDDRPGVVEKRKAIRARVIQRGGIK